MQKMNIYNNLNIYIYIYIYIYCNIKLNNISLNLYIYIILNLIICFVMFFLQQTNMVQKKYLILFPAGLGSKASHKGRCQGANQKNKKNESRCNR